MNDTDRSSLARKGYPNPAKGTEQLEQRVTKLERDVQRIAEAVMFFIEAYVDAPEKTVARTPK